MKNSALIVTTTPYMIRQFLMKDIALLRDMGLKVEIATNMQCFNVLDEKTLSEFQKTLDDMGIVVHQIDFTRSMFDFKSIFQSYTQMKKLLKGSDYRLMHTHTPIASAIARIASRRFKNMRVIYTAHGFHFYKGAPLKNWVLFFAMEWICSWWTDVLITINKEDYSRAKSRLHARRTEYIPGVGIDLEKFSLSNVDKKAIRRELGISEENLMLLSVGELNENKNHEIVIRALAELKDKHIHYAIAGQGDLSGRLTDLSRQLGIENQVHLLGFRTDIPRLYNGADVFVFPSIREGLSVALMEAMAGGLPVVCSRIRGNTDLIEEGKGGFFFSPKEVTEVKESLIRILKSNLEEMGEFNKKYIQKFSCEKVSDEMYRLYSSLWVR